MDSRKPRRPDTYIPTVSLAGRPAFHHLRMCQYVFALYILYSVLGLRSVMATALDSDERLHSEVGLKHERQVRVRYTVASPAGGPS